jgi:S1-C subfamily serine protease
MTKPGWKTSEFWLTALTKLIVGAIALSSFLAAHHQEAQDAIQQITAGASAIWALTLLARGYLASRTSVKTSPLQLPKLVFALCLFLLPGAAFGQCGPEGCPSGSWGSASSEQLAPQRPTIADCVVLIQGEDGGSGAGTAIDYRNDQVIILTCRHVCEAAGRPTVVFRDGRRISGAILVMDSAADLALVSAPCSNKPPLCTVADAEPQPGQRLWKVGYAGRQLNVTTGPIVRVLDRDLWIHTRCRPGDSGGGLFDDQGRVVGVCEAYLTDQPEVGVGVRLVCIRRFLDRWAQQRIERRKLPTPPNIGPIPPRPSTDTSAALAAIDRLNQQLQGLQAKLDAFRPEPGLAGPPGQQGPPGPPGPPGTSADTADLRNRLAALEQKFNNIAGTIRVQVSPKPHN